MLLLCRVVPYMMMLFACVTINILSVSSEGFLPPNMAFFVRQQMQISSKIFDFSIFTTTV